MIKKTIREGFVIAIIVGGFVFVGHTKKDDDFYIMTNAKNIRKWGTSKGLGELAKNGPLEKTILDDYGQIEIPEKSAIFFICTDESLWK